MLIEYMHWLACLPFSSGPQTNWRSPDNGNGNGSLEASPVSQAKSSEKPASKPVPKTNGFREEHNHRGNGYISITGTSVGSSRVLDWVECWTVGQILLLMAMDFAICSE